MYEFSNNLDIGFLFFFFLMKNRLKKKRERESYDFNFEESPLYYNFNNLLNLNFSILILRTLLKFVDFKLSSCKFTFFRNFNQDVYIYILLEIEIVENFKVDKI